METVFDVLQAMRSASPQLADFATRIELAASARERVYWIVDGEREWQDRKWGTIGVHPHEVGAWLTIMRCLLADAEKAWAGASNDEQALHEIRKVIGTGVACAEQHGLPRRWPHGEMDRKREASP